MLKQINLIALFCLLILGCKSPVKTEKIKVGVFDGHGGAQTCIWETYEAVKIDKGIDVNYILSSDIASGCLDTLDVIIIPGGGGSRQFLNLGYENQKRIKDFISSGKGAVGICAGAYLFSNTPSYACISVNGAQATDIEHDNRGHGLAKFTLTPEGKTIFPELAKYDTSYVYYYEGPVFIDAPDSISFQTLAIMQSDVHEEGNAPSNTTNNKPFFIANNYGKGRVFSTIAHPEATPGMRWLIPRMVRWAANKEFVSYSANSVKPELFNREILFTSEMLSKESGYFKVLLYGSPKEKVDALSWLEGCISWDTKRWVQGMLYDSLAIVRKRAAQYISNSEFTHYIPDLKAAYSKETDLDTKEAMKQCLTSLEAQ